MSELDKIAEGLSKYVDLEGAKKFFTSLGYPVQGPLPISEVSEFPGSLQKLIFSFNLISDCRDGSSLFRIYHVELNSPNLRRTDIRAILESFYRRFPQGYNLFVFSTTQKPYEELLFISPKRLQDLRKSCDSTRVRLWLRTLVTNPKTPFRTDREILNSIRTEGNLDPLAVWQKHEESFSVQRVTEKFYEEFRRVFFKIQEHLLGFRNDPHWAHDFSLQFLNRLLFIYFIQRKGWLNGPDGKPSRNFLRYFWQAYKEARDSGKVKPDTFYKEWLSVLFFEAFNNKWQNRSEYLIRFPQWIKESLALAPYLNGGLFSANKLDEFLSGSLGDGVFSELFDQWEDGTTPGFFERYNFTIVESSRFDEEVAVDPEMLGKVYESLVNITFEGITQEDRRGQAGIFYTPRTEIDLMCRLSLVDWLTGQLGKEHQPLLYELVFAYSPEEKREVDERITSKNLWPVLNQLLENITVLDPACGSGSFLVGMLLILDDLIGRAHAQLGVEETSYERRRRIIGRSLYGVDVMEWAVRVAELRLWLQLVVETGLEPAELKFHPLLPNLSFKVRPGDSLVQQLGGINFTLHSSHRDIPPELKGPLTRLKGEKLKFYFNDPSRQFRTEQEIKNEELRLFQDILDSKKLIIEKEIKKNRQILNPKQISLNGDLGLSVDEKTARKKEAEISLLETELDLIHKALSNLGKVKEIPFIWDVAFVEIFEGEKKGFDIVIGNPPYVRQEKITDPLGQLSRSEYLECLNRSLSEIYPSFFKKRSLSRRSDLYIYFYLFGLSLLNRKGSFCFITSNSWLDVDFGKDLQEFLLKHSHVKLIIDNRAKRSFSQADVNTVIVLLSPPTEFPQSEGEMKERYACFVAFTVPFEEVLSAVPFLEIADPLLYHPHFHLAVQRNPEFRAIIKDQQSLFEEGLELPGEEGNFVPSLYTGNKWGGKYLRAPDIYFTILEKGKGKLVPLKEVADVRFGIKTGANEFFYLQPVGKTVAQVVELAERDSQVLVRVRNGIRWEGEIETGWLKPVIKSPRDIRRLVVPLEDLRTLIFMPPDDARAVMSEAARLNKPEKVTFYLNHHYPKAISYIRWGEARGYPNGSTCSSRKWWWDVGAHKKPQLVFPCSIGDTFKVFLNFFAWIDKRLYEGFADQPEILSGLCNASITPMFAELGSRTGLGEGLLDMTVYEIAALPVLNYLVLTNVQRQRLLSAFERLAEREVRSIFEELGFLLCRQRRCAHPEHPYEFVKPDELTLEQVKNASPNRFELDSVVFDALDLTDEERLAVYRAVVELVKSRLVRARSV